MEPNAVFKSSFGGSPITSFPDYVKRVKKYALLKDEDFCAIACILKQVCDKYEYINQAMNYKLFACAVLAYIKMYFDNLQTNTYYGHIFGIHITTLNKLELEFLEMLDWNVNVSIEQYDINSEWLKNNNSDCPQLIEHVFSFKKLHILKET